MNGELQFIAAPDYENPDDAGGDHNVYNVTITAEDGHNNVSTQDARRWRSPTTRATDVPAGDHSSGQGRASSCDRWDRLLRYQPPHRDSAGRHTKRWHTSSSAPLGTTPNRAGNQGSDKIFGLGGDDKIQGNSDADQLFGGSGI